MARRATESMHPSAPSGGRDSARCPAAPSAAAGEGKSRFFYSEAEAARDWNMSPGGLSLARSRGEIGDAYETCGRRVLWSRLTPRLHALGIRSPEDLGRFCKGAGIRDLAGLLEFLGASS